MDDILALFFLNLLIIDEVLDQPNSPTGQNKETRTVDRQLEIPLVHDSTFNLLVCSECNVAIPHDWVVAHLKDNHGISKGYEDINAFLELEEHCVTSVEAKAWLDSMWILPKPIVHVPIISGHRCLRCNYCCHGRAVLKKHFQRSHPGISWKENHERCLAQQPFKGQLSKYLLVPSNNASEILNDEPEWKIALEQDFWDTTEYQAQLHDKDGGNTRVLSAFIAKTRSFF